MACAKHIVRTAKAARTEEKPSLAVRGIHAIGRWRTGRINRKFDRKMAEVASAERIAKGHIDAQHKILDVREQSARKWQQFLKSGKPIQIVS